MDWYVLGIDPTKDKKAITNAYREKLRSTNPEDHPEEFKALRAAYEEALRLAAQPETQQAQDLSPLGKWTAELRRIYGDLSLRIDPAAWAKLLSDPICSGLDSRSAVEDALIQFLMGQYILPHTVWLLLNEKFSLLDRREELYEHYPRDFIDQVVLHGIRHEDSLRLELFQPGRDGAACDKYTQLYFQVIQTPPDQTEDLLRQLESLPEQHPYGQLIRFLSMYRAGSQDTAVAGIRGLSEAYPDDSHLGTTWADICIRTGDFHHAQTLAQSLLDQDAKNPAAKRILAQSLAAQEEFTRAKELVYELLHQAAGDPIQTELLGNLLREWNETLISQKEAQWQADPEDMENATELAWCYIQNERPADAMSIAKQLDPERTDPFEYHNLLGKLNHNQQQYKEALPHFQKAVALLRNMASDGTEKTEKKRRRLPEFLQLLGNCLLQVRSEEEAKPYFEEALTLAPEDPEVLTIMGRMLYASADYLRSIEILEKLIAVMPEAAHGYVLLSLCYYKLHQDRDAFDAVNRALSIMPQDLTSYILKMHILLRNGVFEEVHGILDFLEESKAPESLSVEFIRALLTELEEKDEKKALIRYRAILDLLEQQEAEDLLLPALLYFRTAVLQGAAGETSIEDLIALLDRGLAEDAYDEDCLSYKAWLLSRAGRVEEAIEMYRTILARTGQQSIAYGLAEIYSQNLPRYAEEAFRYYQTQLETHQTPELYFYAATALRQMGDYEGARRYYQQELELNPDDVDGWNGLAHLCDALGQYDDSLGYINRALAAMERSETVHTWLIEHKLLILLRMNDQEGAIAFVDEAADRYGYADGFSRKFEIYCQFGAWDQIQALLTQRKRSGSNDVDFLKAQGRYHLLRGELFRSALAMGKLKHRLPFEEIQDYRLQLNDLECSHKRMLQIRTRRAQENPNDDYVLMNFAESLWRTGDQKSAVQIAAKALAILDETLKLHLVDEAMYRSRRCLLLAMVGRIDEARAELEHTRNLPLCEHCEYHRCKDADIFEAQIEELLGNTQRAKELYLQGRENWPDEPDFLAGLARMKKKGK